MLGGALNELPSQSASVFNDLLVRQQLLSSQCQSMVCLRNCAEGTKIWGPHLEKKFWSPPVLQLGMEMAL